MNQNRRDYYRIKAKAHIQYQLTDGSESGLAEPRFRHQAYLEMMDELYSLDLECNRLLGHLPDSDRTVAPLIRLINKKTELIARSFALSEANIPEEDFQTVDISEGGMAFHSANLMQQGQTLAIRVIFIPDFFSIYAQAQVVECEAPGDINAPKKLPHWMRINFVSIDEKEQQLLARYVLKRQQQRQKSRVDGKK